MLKQWLDESYRAQAPEEKLGQAALDAGELNGSSG